MSLSLGLQPQLGGRTLIQRAIASLRARGSDAHLWLPGVGTLNGLTTGNYLESTGNTFATVDNPTGLVLDALGTKITKTVPLFSGLRATITSSTFPATAMCTANGNYGFTGTSIYTYGGVYEYTITWSGNTANKGLIVDGGLGIAFSNAQSGTKTFICRQVEPGFYCYVPSGLIGESFTIDSFSVREVTGIHLTQGTTANKPVLRRGLVNLLTYSKTVGGTSWALLGGLTSSGLVTAPDGTNTANTFLVSGSAYLQHNISGFASGASGTVAIWAKQSASGAANGIRLTTNNASAWSTGISQYFPLTPTWQLIVLSGVLQTGGASTTISYGAQLADASSDPNCYGNVDLVDAGCFLGTYTASQILAAGGIPVTTTAAASNPAAGKYSWSFDGSNDSFGTTMTVTDEVTIVQGLNASKLAYMSPVNTTGAATECYKIKLRDNGDIWVTAKNSASVETLLINSAAKYQANVPFVVCLRKYGTTLQKRVNGIVYEQNTSAVSGGGANTLVIATGDGEYFQGSLGPTIAIKGTVTDAELLMYERLIAALTPGAPSF